MKNDMHWLVKVIEDFRELQDVSSRQLSLDAGQSVSWWSDIKRNGKLSNLEALEKALHSLGYILAVVKDEE